ncbi:hypothetical protein BO71DRAFT_403344 [Aspergillus ellipticus CBS 707.79]|uniref:Uncharacterized protein n=1 Tax=Aspergillus ellipticus CBS 707.79 TaxID=1448320 RepID=A0A319CV21_9EURO|nr:hypothetical protein BO71DRAFT_403344 [Aspergillus ellipticus CBS 707.79]
MALPMDPGSISGFFSAAPLSLVNVVTVTSSRPAIVWLGPQHVKPAYISGNRDPAHRDYCKQTERGTLSSV